MRISVAIDVAVEAEDERGLDGQVVRAAGAGRSAAHPHDRAPGRRRPPCVQPRRRLRQCVGRPRARPRASPRRGAGRPVISSTCAAAWCSSISAPLTTVARRPRRRAASGGRPRVVDDVEHGLPGATPRRRAGRRRRRAASRRPGRRPARRVEPRSGSTSTSTPTARRVAAQLVGAGRVAHQHACTASTPEREQRRERRLRRPARAEHRHGRRGATARSAQRADDAGDVGVVGAQPPPAGQQGVGRPDRARPAAHLGRDVERGPLERHRAREPGPVGARRPARPAARRRRSRSRRSVQSRPSAA